MPRVNIMLPDDILEQMDALAREEGMNRSQLIRTAFLVFTQVRSENTEKIQRQEDIQRAMELQDQLRQTAGPWNPQEFIREKRQVR
jgi:metal-responsive CopG/Arc/MetJ family transcriptional regulator